MANLIKQQPLLSKYSLIITLAQLMIVISHVRTTSHQTAIHARHTFTREGGNSLYLQPKETVGGRQLSTAAEQVKCYANPRLSFTPAFI